ncbi:DUF882 domain-containing protein [Aerophototrophica crusticola]|uniref:Murein endopeptidase K n=1 Tax=Aerophototrophica crusticola TaxID=1709002 RepID=A0A858RBE4_9PROT|nr:DUF882 domain-containing protein [Rhodospirillaceae bacterium B3]
MVERPSGTDLTNPSTSRPESPENSDAPDAARRGFLRSVCKLGLAAGAAICLPTLITDTAEAASLSAPRRTLQFVSLHTGEKLKVTYWADGRYLPTALQDVNEMLRDWRTGEQTRMDPKLLDLLFQLRQKLRADQAFQVISGYRSPKTNSMLHASSDGVASKSLHMEGKAIDIDMAGRQLKKIRQAALDLRLGGVGYYPKSSFVHVDTGRVRQW